MTPPARLPPVQAWAIVDEKGKIQVHLGMYESAVDARTILSDVGHSEPAYHVVRVTVRAWAPPTRKKRKRYERIGVLQRERF